MNEELKENGLTNEENETKDYEFSWRKLCGWLSLVMSILTPVAAIGISIMAMSSTTDDEKNEVSILCYISIAVATFYLLNDLVLKFFTF